MGRKITDGEAIDFTAPAATLVEKGELYRVDNISHIALDQIDATEVDKVYAGEVRRSLWRVKVPAGTCAARGDLVYWTTGAGFKSGATDLQAAALGIAVAKTEGVRNSRGYATVWLLNAGA